MYSSQNQYFGEINRMYDVGMHVKILDNSLTQNSCFQPLTGEVAEITEVLPTLKSCLRIEFLDEDAKRIHEANGSLRVTPLVVTVVGKEKYDTERIDWDEYFGLMAKAASLRSTCSKQSVGAIVVKDNQVLSTGYNGTPSKIAHCTKVGCKEDSEGHCILSAHAEHNAIVKSKSSVEGASIYCTHKPCLECCKTIINAGIKNVYYLNDYVDDRVKNLDINDQSKLLEKAQVSCERLDVDIDDILSKL